MRKIGALVEAGARVTVVSPEALGDLSGAAVDRKRRQYLRGDLQGAKVRIKDLETAWDEAEERIQPMSPEDWTAMDKSIDRALAQLRSGSPDATACDAALRTLIAKLSSLEKPK